MNIQSLKQQVIGIINLSMPIVIVFSMYPAILHNMFGRIIVALIVGAYVYYLGRKITHTQANSLLYSPTDSHKDEYEKMVVACGIDPQNVRLRYGYTQERIAMTILNTVTIDPLYYHDQDDLDLEMVKVKNILQQHIVVTLSEEEKNRTTKIKNILSDSVQRFIFRHELAHIQYQYSQKKLLINGLITATSALLGICIALHMLAYSGYLALLAGMLTGGICDLFFSYTSNALFTAQEEKKADLFACAHSSKEEIMAAAQFFEQHQVINDEYTAHKIIGKVPPVILTGHPHGLDRAAYLRQQASK